MERALDACPDKEEALYKGVDLVYKQLKDSLVKFGVEEIEAQDADFDPNVHMAVMHCSGKLTVQPPSGTSYVLSAAQTTPIESIKIKFITNKIFRSIISLRS